ncbi:MAG: fatty acid cis/trans isomerase [Myxococcota bacterium]|nr:fatty acid cis/trans isomerase [Myxococcota bacterium]
MLSLNPLALRVLIGLVCVLGFTSCQRGPEVDLPPLPTQVSEQDSPVVVTPAAAQAIIDARCVVCHACYDAPCQLVLSSPEGLQRGASKEAVYHAERIRAAKPSRLFVDASTTEEWRQRDFFTVLQGAEPNSPQLLRLMLELGAANPPPKGQKLPAEVDLAIVRPLSCPTVNQFGRYVRDHSMGGMPYGTAPLSRTELVTLGAWLADGAPSDRPEPAMAPETQKALKQWESFLNGPSLKERIVSRYLYEHWFQAHLYFETASEGPFFRIVRSSTAPGQPIQEIATRRPYDDPGTTSFWYRLRPVTSTIVHKTHTLYPLGDAKKARLTELFLESEWSPTRFPSYETKEASNPFVAFKEIPARARYQYMLDNAQFFVMSFIRGPVCRGQVATNVIQDHFFVAFLDPDHDVSITQPEFLEANQAFLDLPAEHLSQLTPSAFLGEYRRHQHDYLSRRSQAYAEAHPEGLGLNSVWDGEQENTNALLTVFRHWDNATVIEGWQGGWPKTAWIIDYPIFERIYYDLVAGFDVFGNFTHQASTRLYMDHLRMQGELNFVALLPPESRKEIHESWYIGASRSVDYRWADKFDDPNYPTAVRYEEGGEFKVQLYEKILKANAAVAGPADSLNRCKEDSCPSTATLPWQKETEDKLRWLTSVRGPWIQNLPEVTRLRIRSGSEASTWTLVRNIDHKNVAYMFHEENRIDSSKDTLTIVRGYLGSYPNFAFDVDLNQLDAFIAALQAALSEDEFSALAGRWGVRRTDPQFWPTMDWFVSDFQEQSPTEAGLFDLARYGNY